MIVIRHSDGGWSASNEASIVDKRTPVYEEGKLVSMKKYKECVITDPYVVSGSLEGIVKIAIKDDVSGSVSCFDGECITPIRILLLKEIDNNWLKSIK